MAGRGYPAVLAGELSPEGIPIHDEKELEKLIKELTVGEVVFAYSDVPHEYVMHKASMVNAAGVDYEAILRQAEQEVDIVLWDGGNNDFPLKLLW